MKYIGTRYMVYVYIYNTRLVIKYFFELVFINVFTI